MAAHISRKYNVYMVTDVDYGDGHMDTSKVFAETTYAVSVEQAENNVRYNREGKAPAMQIFPMRGDGSTTIRYEAIPVKELGVDGYCEKCRGGYKKCSLRICPKDGKQVCRYCCQKCPQSYRAVIYAGVVGERCKLLDMKRQEEEK